MRNTSTHTLGMAHEPTPLSRARRRLRVWSVLALALGSLSLLLVITLLAMPGVARASLSWSSPIVLDQNGSRIEPELRGPACPTSSQCTTIDVWGREVTFNPASPQSSVTAWPIDAGRIPYGIACPTSSQCTAVDSGHLLTFNPTAPQSVNKTSVANVGLRAIACPTSSQCTAVSEGNFGGGVGEEGHEVTFDPASPGSPTAVTVPSPGTAIACPSPTQCTTVGQGGVEATFNPASPASATSATIDGGVWLLNVACPTISQCTAVNSQGEEITFDPVSPVGATPVAIDSGFYDSFFGVACTSTSLCVATDNNGQEVTFDPVSPGSPSPIVVSSAGHYLQVACPVEHQCAVVEVLGNEVTFDPTSPGSPMPTKIDLATELTAVACSAADQCAVMDERGYEITLDPASPTGPTPTKVGNAGRYTIACVVRTQCTALSDKGEESTFDPSSPDSPIAAKVGGSLHSLTCPTAGQCTAIEWTCGGCEPFEPYDNAEVTFEPSSPAGAKTEWLRTAIKPALPAPFRGVACPVSTQCTAVSEAGEEATFEPGSPYGLRLVRSGLPYAFAAVACPTTEQCTAIDVAGYGDTFNPLNPYMAPIGAADSGVECETWGCVTISCPSTSFCVAADIAGDVIEGDPTSTQGWTIVPIAGATTLTGIACRSPAQCVAVDSTGHAFVGIASGPASVSPPAISGSAQQGQTLTETHATWSGSPTSYSYQWEDCDSAGFGCTAIVGATGQTYTLTPSDIEHTIRVQETATNGDGASAPAPSNSTASVQAYIPPPPPPIPTNISPPTISGTPTPGQVLTEAHGAWTGSPSTYGYQWQDCDGGGNNCTAIAGATGQTYTLTANDVEHTIRMQETATNASGTSAPASSNATALVLQATVFAPVNVSPPSTPSCPNGATPHFLNSTTWTCAGLSGTYQAPSSGPAPSGTRPPTQLATSTAIAGGAGSATATARGSFTVPGLNVSCGAGPCHVQATATGASAGASKAAVARHRKRHSALKLGSTSFTLASGQTSQVTISLTSAARSALARLGSLRATVTVTDTDGHGSRQSRTITVTIKAARRAKKHKR
jgi:hypothetical protein